MATGDNFIQCGNDFDLQTIAMSLYGSVQGCTYIRQYCSSNVSDCVPIECGTFQTLTDLVRGAIAIACDNRPALRTINTDFSRVSNEAAFSCGGGLTWDDAFISLFADAGGGDICLMLGTLNADSSDVGVNLISCGNDIDYDSLLMSLIGVAHLEGGDCNFLRTHAVYLQPDCSPIACGTFQSFLDLFRQSIVITDDGLPALRVYYYTDNCNDYSPFSCAAGVTEDEAMNQIFWSVGGEIAIAAMCITDQN